ncbi:MAG: NAD(P)-binding protein [Candidatus Acidiferrales bacterium]
MALSNKSPVVVLGGGISGLTAARTLQEQRRPYILLEKCPTLGGLTRTVEVGEFCFDYTGHFLHLCRYRTPEDIPYANLKNDEWTQITRRSCCFVGGQLITAPIQYNLAELPPELFARCAESYEKRPTLSNDENATFRDYVVSGFGQELADLFLIPQNEKTMAIQLDQLSRRAVRRFFPAPDEALVRAGMTTRKTGSDKATGYNSAFWYPTMGGIGRLVQGLRTGIDSCALNQDVVAVDLQKKTVRTKNHDTFSWDVIFSSIPLKSLCEMTGDAELVRQAAQLSYSSTVSFNIGMRCPLRPEFRDIHWLYVPDRTIPFYRVGFYSNIGEGTCTPGHSSLYVEVGLRSEETDRINLIDSLQPRVMKSLEELGWIDSRAVNCVVVHVMRHAYVHHTPSRDAALDAILGRLREAGVHPVGRYGLWDYTSMEDSMESARSAVLEVVQ